MLASRGTWADGTARGWSWWSCGDIAAFTVIQCRCLPRICVYRCGFGSITIPCQPLLCSKNKELLSVSPSYPPASTKNRPVAPCSNSSTILSWPDCDQYPEFALPFAAVSLYGSEERSTLICASPAQQPQTVSNFLGVGRAQFARALAVSSSEVGPELLSEAALLSAAQAAATGPRRRSVARMGFVSEERSSPFYTLPRELSSPVWKGKGKTLARKN